MPLQYCCVAVSNVPTGPVMSKTGLAGEEASLNDWDEGAPWHHWTSPRDPIQCLQLERIWCNLDMDLDLSLWHLPHGQRPMWKVAVLSSLPHKQRPATALRLDKGSNAIAKGGLTEMLQNLSTKAVCAADARDLNDLLEDYWRREHIPLPRTPPEGVMQRVLQDLFFVEDDPDNSTAADHGICPSQGLDESNLPVLVGAAPPGSLLLRLASHCLVFGNARAISELWQRFVRELRFRCWEDNQEIPRIWVSEQQPDLSTSILHQKIQMLAICISARHNSHGDRELSKAEPAESYSSDDFHSCSDEDMLAGVEAAGAEGVASVHPSLKLLNADNTPLNVPKLQRFTPATHDILMEKHKLLEQLDRTSMDQIRMQVQGKQLLSDMSAFKAANPRATMEDFVRWYSPSDWSIDSTQGTGGCMSVRMSTSGNAWQQLWEQAKPCPAERQKLLFDPACEGERALHFLETLPAKDLFQELQVLALTSAFCMMCQANGARLPSVQATMADLVSLSRMELERKVGEDKGNFRLLLHELAFVENVVMTAESLVRRIGLHTCATGLADRLLTSAIKAGGAVVHTSTEDLSFLVANAEDGSGVHDCKPEESDGKQIEWLIQCQALPHLYQSSSHILVTVTSDGIHCSTCTASGMGGI
mmetsp:Transcript_25600/g.71590  ORF Transcript_25600/g.71590 Transcript_25600/m.71590 type:complete len:645 (-) Transcript_25600:914-2848(-)